MLKNDKGFKLIEMLIVLMIISVLIILIVPNLSSKSNQVHDKGCDALVSVVQAQVDLYHLDKNSYPESLDKMVPEYISKDQKKCQDEKELGYSSSSGKVSYPNK